MSEGQDFFPPKVQAAVAAWQAAALSALQPQMQRLVPESLVQLLLGCQRINRGLTIGGGGSSSSSSSGSGGTQGVQQDGSSLAAAAAAAGAKTTTSSSSSRKHEEALLLQQTVLGAAVVALSQHLDQLSPLQLVCLLVGSSKTEAASREFGEQLLSHLQPGLR